MDFMDSFRTPPRINPANRVKYRDQPNRKTQTTDDARKRSERREEFLAKRRSGSFDSPAGAMTAGHLRRESSCNFNDLQEPQMTPSGSHGFLKDVLRKIQLPNEVKRHEAVQEIRSLTALKDNPPLDLLVRMGFIRPLIELLSPDVEIETRLEAAWALGNIAGGESSNTMAVVAGGALNPLIQLFHPPQNPQTSPPQTPPPQTPQVHTDSIHSDLVRNDSVQIDSVHSDLVQIGSVQTGSVHSDSVQIGSVRNDSILSDFVDISSIHAGSVQIGSVRNDSVQIGSVRNDSVQIDSVQSDLVYQAVWAVGNIVADKGHFRNLAFDNGLLQATLPFLRNKTPIFLLRNFSWLLVNVCRTKNPPPSVDLIETLLPKIVWMIKNEDDFVKTDAVWSLAYLSDEPPELADLLVKDENVLASIQNIPESAPENPRFLMGAVRLLGNLLSGSDAHCDAVIRAEFVKKFPALLALRFVCIQKETLMCLANVAAGSSEQIQTILDVPNLLSKIISFLRSERRSLVQEAVWIISNTVQGGNLHQITSLLEAGVIFPLCEHLSARNVNLVKLVLETIGDLLRRCPSDFLETLCETIRTSGGLAKIEDLLQHDNETLYEMSYVITDTFFKDEEDELDEEFLAKDAATFDFKIPLF